MSIKRKIRGILGIVVGATVAQPWAVVEADCLGVVVLGKMGYTYVVKKHNQTRGLPDIRTGVMIDRNRHWQQQIQRNLRRR